MTEDEQVKLYIEMWKQTIEVQKHFNDIELRIRGLALTVLTFVLGGASLAVRDGTTVRLWGVNFHLGSLILFSGTVLWLTFYFVDGIWYHRLLIGSVIHGEKLEAQIRKTLPEAGLTKQISASSPYLFKVPLPGHRILWQHEIHSPEKLRFFYFVVTAILVVSGIVIQLGLQTPSSPTHTTRPTAITRAVLFRWLFAWRQDSNLVGLTSGYRDRTTHPRSPR